MQKTRRVLGRGLTNLIPVETEDEGAANDISMIDVNAIVINPYQPRTYFAQEEIDGLAESIKMQGLMQPLVVRKKVDGFEIISGERRFRAMKQLAWDKIPCLVKAKITDREMLEMALVENIQRENLNDIELAHAYQRLMTECSISHEELAKRVAKSRSMVSNTLRLLRLPENLQKYVKEGTLSAGHARALLTIEDPQKQSEMAEIAIAGGMSVRTIEAEVQNKNKGLQNDPKAGTSGKTNGIDEKDPDLIQVLEQLQYRFGTSVRIKRMALEKGKIELQFHNEADLTRLLDILLAK